MNACLTIEYNKSHDAISRDKLLNANVPSLSSTEEKSRIIGITYYLVGDKDRERELVAL